MKRSIIPAVFLFGVLWYISCKKEYSCENCLTASSSLPNQPPIAKAGADQTIIFPKDSVLLDGINSIDVDGSITSYAWTNIDGPDPVLIKNANAAQTPVTGLKEGVYHFLLSVVDNRNAIANDTVQIQCIKNSVNNGGFIFNRVWKCNDRCDDNDVYLSTVGGLNLFGNPNVPLEVSVLLDSSTVWATVPRYTIPLPSTKYYYEIRDQVLFVHVVPFPGASRLIGKSVMLKIRFV
jgi:hypothetical protein